MSTQAGAMPDSYLVRWTGRLAILALPQHVGDCNAGQIREQLLWLVNRGAAELIIDMTGTASCDHEGATAVARAHQRATASGTQLRLAVTTGAVQRVLRLNGLDRLIPIHPSLDAAIAAAAPAATVPVTLQRDGRHAAQPRKPAGYAGCSAEGTGLGMGR
jgi:anti-sigma B factor antagonist